MDTITTIDYIVHPFFDLDSRSTMNKVLVKRIEQYMFSRAEEPNRLFLLLLDDASHYGTLIEGVTRKDVLQARYELTVLGDQFYRGFRRTQHSAVVEDYSPAQLSFDGVSLPRLCQIKGFGFSPAVELIGHGLHKDSSVALAMDELSADLYKNFGITPSQRFWPGTVD